MADISTDSPGQISALVRQCIKQLSQAAGADECLKDELVRFKIWAGNVSAHTQGRRSLEHRLRDASNLRSSVAGLLNDLMSTLLRYKRNSEYGGSSPNLIGIEEDSTDDDDGFATIVAEDDEDSDQDDAELFGLSGHDVSSESLREQSLEELHGVISCLMRFSMTLRCPAHHDRLKQSFSTSTLYYEAYDIAHVSERFPDAAPFLHERLGKAISRQRQYFKYRYNHHVKMQEGLEEETEAIDNRSSTIATALQAPETQVIGVVDTDDIQSIGTVTSFAPSLNATTTLRPPPLPDAGRNGEHFECPLCYTMVQTEDDRSWR